MLGFIAWFCHVAFCLAFACVVACVVVLRVG